ncbi:MAG: hypothetical protein BJ554DRAFT_1628 [Olpidium bornovanus]|uniref:Uncharacterized protein n=1 Tax=Olpidium bornovanus TaxID=278681 RepID=A0A8H7ZS27_9FUNG|nr:MAG: hypothetical protein BJ554DRAFT_1628 [Olpidium bornovanus]
MTAAPSASAFGILEEESKQPPPPPHPTPPRPRKLGRQGQKRGCAEMKRCVSRGWPLARVESQGKPHERPFARPRLEPHEDVRVLAQVSAAPAWSEACPPKRSLSVHALRQPGGLSRQLQGGDAVDGRRVQAAWHDNCRWFLRRRRGRVSSPFPGRRLQYCVRQGVRQDRPVVCPAQQAGFLRVKRKRVNPVA